jgi:hypothetical protein
VRTRVVATLLLLGLVAIFSACGSIAGDGPPARPTPTPSGYAIKGKLTTACRSKYQISYAAVTVYNETGTVIASTTTTTVNDAVSRSAIQRATNLENRRLADVNETLDLERARFLEDSAAVDAWGRAGMSGPQPNTSMPSQRENDLKTEADDLERQASAIELTCAVDFLTMVPAAKCYQIQIGNYFTPVYAFDELRARNFTVELLLR